MSIQDPVLELGSGGLPSTDVVSVSGDWGEGSWDLEFGIQQPQLPGSTCCASGLRGCGFRSQDPVGRGSGSWDPGFGELRASHSECRDLAVEAEGSGTPVSR